MESVFEAIIVISLLLVLYVIIMLVVGWLNSIKPGCPVGQRAISVDGSKSILPKSDTDIVTPTADYPICSPVLSCPLAGQKWAIHPDGSALTNSCIESGCPCSSFRHCPAYSSTIFRQYGTDDRISLFQIIDPLVKTTTSPPDPYDTPYLIDPGSQDFCFLNSSTLQLLWPTMALGEPCLRGTLSKVKSNQSQYVCAPTAFVTGVGKDAIFDDTSYMKAYRT